MRSDLAALGAVILWGSLAALGASLSHVPPFLLTGIGLLIGSLVALPVSKFDLRQLKATPKAIAVGVFGLFGYHASLFAGLQNAPSVQANLVNYLWPLLIVVLAPLFIPGTPLTLKHTLAALGGFVGAGIAILSGTELVSGLAIGYFYAFAAAIIWASYSLLSKRVHFRTASVGLFAAIAGLLSLAIHFLFETTAVIDPSDWLLLLALGIGPLGASFYLWDYALKNGDAQRVGLIAFLTPLLSTVLLLLVTGSPLTPLLLLSAALIFGGAFYGGRVNN